MTIKNGNYSKPILTPNTTLIRAYLIMKKLDCLELPVLLEDSVIGVVRRNEIQKLMQELVDQKDGPKSIVTIGQFMDTAVTSADENATLSTTIDGMLRKTLSSVVVHKGTEIKGILSYPTLLKYLSLLSSQNSTTLNEVMQRINT